MLSSEVKTAVILCSNQCDSLNVICFQHDLGWVKADSTVLAKVTELTVLWGTEKFFLISFLLYHFCRITLIALIYIGINLQYTILINLIIHWLLLIKTKIHPYFAIGQAQLWKMSYAKRDNFVTIYEKIFHDVLITSTSCPLCVKTYHTIYGHCCQII